MWHRFGLRRGAEGDLLEQRCTGPPGPDPHPAPAPVRKPAPALRGKRREIGAAVRAADLCRQAHTGEVFSWDRWGGGAP